MTKLSNKAIILLLVSCIEGGLVMALELVIAKLITPFFGGSVYTWAALLSFALSGLALGYFAGSVLSKKYEDVSKLLMYVLFLSFVFMLPAVFFSESILNVFGTMSLKPGVLLSCGLFVTPVLFCWGVVSPLIIKLMQQSSKETVAGKSSALIYTVSTVGGVLFTILFGFYFIPYLGLHFSLYVILFLVVLLLCLVTIYKTISKNVTS